jgi:hypothetical protein
MRARRRGCGLSEAGLRALGHQGCRHLRDVRYDGHRCRPIAPGVPSWVGLCRGDTPRVGADNPGWVPPEAGAVRAWPVALTLMDQARAWKHDTDLGNRLADQAFGLLGRGHEYVCEAGAPR